MRKTLPFLILAAVFSLSTTVFSAEPQQAGHSRHGAGCHLDRVNANGDREMGFSHQTTKHCFTLLADGGTIRVSANEPTDVPTVTRIREHLSHIAGAFAEGDFSMPRAIHGRVPPGTVTMKRKRRVIGYVFQETETGGEVRITTADPHALAAIHSFLRFQIKDHATGDSPAVLKK